MKSMTGYAKVTNEMSGITYTLEVKGVNHRYLNLSFSIPSLFSSFEVKSIPVIRQYVNRGSINVRAEISGDFEENLVHPDLALAKAYYNATRVLSEELGLIRSELSVENLLNMRELFKMEMDTSTEEKIWKGFEETLREVLQKYNESRRIEGEKLKKYIRSYIDEFENVLKEMIRYEGDNRKRYEEIIRERIEKFSSLQIDQQRMEQEVVMLIQRADISEELARLKSHVSRARRLLDSEDAVGSELDFVFQEFGREVNTLSNKSKIPEVLEYIVEAKTLIKKLREQVQNIE